MRRAFAIALFIGLAAAVVAIPATAGASPAPSLSDIQVRDQLIADQKSLLDAYRCMFNAETDQVAGGCAGGAPVTPPAEPSPFAGTPTASDLTARDGLVADQEELLNAYRCKFNIDTQIVPGGCSGGLPSGKSDRAIVEQLRRNADEFSYEIGNRGGALTVATISEPLTFNLEMSRDSGSSNVLGYLFEGLTQTSWLNDEIEPMLAQSWEHSDDGLRWVFHLRDDVRWHDGTPFTAHDVEFTFRRVIYNDDFEASSRASFEFRFLNSETGQWDESQMTVTALDDHTVEIVLPQPFAPFLRSMGTAIYPKHILEGPIEAGTFEDFWGIDTDPAEIIGTGPFTIGEYTPGVRIVYERNPDYWLLDADGKRLPYLDRVVELIVEQYEDELALFRDGTTDFYGVLGAEFALLDPLADSENFTLHRRGPGFGTNFLAFNQNPGLNQDGVSYVDPVKLRWFQAVEFRQAVAHSMDKKAMVDGIQHGLGYLQWSSISPAAGDFHNPGVRQYAYDVEKANEILDGLGWVDTDGDGIREDDMGNPISFRMVTNEGNSVRADITRIIHEGMTEDWSRR